MNSRTLNRTFAPSEQVSRSGRIVADERYPAGYAHQQSPKRPGKSHGIRRYAILFILLIVCALSIFCGGGYLLVADDPLPPKVDGAVALQGSVLGQEARIAGAVQLIKQGTTTRVLLSVPKESYWGQPVAPIAHDYLERIYGADVVNHIEFCETFDVDSTEDEAKALLECINQRSWHTVTIVTSDYHTRRAGMIWRRVLRQQNSPLDLRMHAVPDPEFHPGGWWRKRRSAKTWLFEFTKLLWTVAGGN